MFTDAERVDWLRQGFEDLQAEGREWVELPEAARYGMVHLEKYMRRRRAVNGFLGKVGVHRPDMPKKAPFQYRNIEASMAAEAMEEQGMLEYQYLNSEGELFIPPPRQPGVPGMKLDYRDRRYHYIPVAVQTEPSAPLADTSPVRRLPGPVVME